MLIVSDSQKCIINEIITLAASCTQADCVELIFLFGTCIHALYSQLLWVAEQSREWDAAMLRGAHVCLQ